MNWLDWSLMLLLGLAAFRGFQRGFIIELAALLALVLGIRAATRVSDRVAAALGIGEENAALAFLVTFLGVLLLVHIMARLLTTLIELAQLGLPNKLAGIAFGIVRSAFVLSVMLNLLVGYTEGAMPPAGTRDASAMYGPMRGFAPLLVPALGDTEWVQWAVGEMREGANAVLQE
jgi:membrane protein required for colicin V production